MLGSTDALLSLVYEKLVNVSGGSAHPPLEKRAEFLTIDLISAGIKLCTARNFSVDTAETDRK